MALNLKGRSFLTLMDFAPEEIRYMLDLAKDLKAKRRAGICSEVLKGMSTMLPIACILLLGLTMGTLVKQLDTGNYLSSIFMSALVPELLPLLTSLWLAPTVFPSTAEGMLKKFRFIKKLCGKSCKTKLNWPVFMHKIRND